MKKTEISLEEISVLYVESDETLLSSVSSWLNKRFTTVYSVSTAEEALILFHKHHIDLIITEYLLPKMSGLGLVRLIREKTFNIPVILITDYLDNAGAVDNRFVMDMINLGITRLVSKPISMEALQQSVDVAVQRAVAENLNYKNQMQELELLKYRAKYHSSQQKMAFLKELHAIRNDYETRVVDVINNSGEKKRWMLDLLYRGQDIMSGDSYSILNIGENRAFCFILDAMGSGVGASVTSMMSTTFINYMVEKKGSPIDLKAFIAEFLTYVQKILLKDEIFCIMFMIIDFVKEEIEYCNFNMPKIYLCDTNNNLITVKCNNLPIMRYNRDFMIDRISVSGISRMLISSDGLNEAGDDKSSYGEFIAQDFKNSDMLSELKESFFSRYPEPDDDLSVIFLRSVCANPLWEESLTVNTSLAELHRAEHFFDNVVAKTNMNRTDASKLGIAFTEAIMNAFEHGNLGLDLMDKHNALDKGIYDDMIAEKQLNNFDKKIVVRFGVYGGYSGKNYLQLSIEDEGGGVPQKIEPAADRDPFLLCGRGMAIIGQYVDHFYYSPKGNEIILVKKIKEE